MSDKLDMQAKNNSEIIKKCVSILKLLADYIMLQKKKAIKKEKQEQKILMVNANEEKK